MANGRWSPGSPERLALRLPRSAGLSAERQEKIRPKNQSATIIATSRTTTRTYVGVIITGGSRFKVHGSSVLSQPRVDNYPERGARLARREERTYREYVSDEQRSQAGCPARRIVKYWLGQDTNIRRWCPALASGTGQMCRHQQ